MVNKVTLIGNLGKDPEVRTLENGTKVCSFSLATNESYKDKSDNWQTLTEWHNIVAWRGLAEKAERELKKGSTAYIDGKITHRKYQDKDGIERQTTDIVANQLYAFERKDRNNIENPFSNVQDDPFSKVSNASSSIPEAQKSSDNFEDDLPF